MFHCLLYYCNAISLQTVSDGTVVHKSSLIEIQDTGRQEGVVSSKAMCVQNIKIACHGFTDRANEKLLESLFTFKDAFNFRRRR